MGGLIASFCLKKDLGDYLKTFKMVRSTRNTRGLLSQNLMGEVFFSAVLGHFHHSFIIIHFSSFQESQNYIYFN